MIFWTVFFPMFWFILYYGVLLKRGKYGNLTPGQRLTISVAMVLYGMGILLMGIAALIYAVKSTWCLDVGATITTFWRDKPRIGFGRDDISLDSGFFEIFDPWRHFCNTTMDYCHLLQKGACCHDKINTREKFCSWTSSVCAKATTSHGHSRLIAT